MNYQYVEKILTHREHGFWKSAKVFTFTPESGFTINQNRCSQSTRISVHVHPEYAAA